MKNKILNKFYESLENQRTIAEMSGRYRYSNDNKVVKKFLNLVTIKEGEKGINLDDVKDEIRELYN